MKPTFPDPCAGVDCSSSDVNMCIDGDCVCGKPGVKCMSGTTLPVCGDEKGAYPPATPDDADARCVVIETPFK